MKEKVPSFARIYMCMANIHILVHIARIFTSCQSSTIGSVRISHKILTMNDMIQNSKFHFLILFRKIIIHTSLFNYIVLCSIESWHSTQTDTIHKRRQSSSGEFLSVTQKASETFWFFFPFICTYVYTHTFHIHAHI